MHSVAARREGAAQAKLLYYLALGLHFNRSHGGVESVGSVEEQAAKLLQDKQVAL